MKSFRLRSPGPAALLVIIIGLLLSNPGGGWFETTVSASSDTSGAAPLTVLHAFAGGGALHPNGAPIQAADGNFYGTTNGGGLYNLGTVFMMTHAGAVTVLHVFSGGTTDGAGPSAALIQATNGNFYGTTYSGGASGLGTIFTMTPDGTVAILHSFSGGLTDGAFPSVALLEATDGKFYGTTSNGGAFSQGTVFTMTPDGAVNVLHAFGGGETDGAYPYAALVQATDGKLYGTAAIGGTLDQGIVFTITPDNSDFTVLHSFAGGTTDGAYPYAPLVQAADGNFYGTTQSGGESNQGTVFTITPDGAVNVLHIFNGGATDGAYPFFDALIQTTDGNFYGTTPSGGASQQGTVFAIIDGSFSVVHSFAGGPTDGFYLGGALIQATDGNLYGTTYFGGESGGGSAFRMTTAGSFTVLHSFSGGTDGTSPYPALLQATDGNFYGTTMSGGASGVGTVFMMTPAGITTVLHYFGGTDGAYPSAALLQATDGNFYGTTANGGQSGQGTVFTITSDGTFSVLHMFTGETTDGAYPFAALIQATDGKLYGTTQNGGTYGQGTVFTITNAGTFTVLHSFGGGTDGSAPEAALIQATDGDFYGTTYVGGLSNLGTVFRITSAGTVTVLHTFETTDGAYPYGALIQGTDGNFFGTTQSGGQDHGTIYTMTPSGTFTVLHSFAGVPTDGANSSAALVQAIDGNFYGTSQAGGPSGFGTAFRMTPAGTVTVLHAFSSGVDGGYPGAALIQATDGNFYGTTASGGEFGQGVVFMLQAPPSITPSATTGVPGANVTATIANGPGNRTDWVALSATGAPATNYVQWQYLNGTHTAPTVGRRGAALTFTLPRAPGTYELRFFRNNTYTVLAASASITSAAAAPTVTPSVTTAALGATVTATVANGPEYRGDWVALSATGALATNYLQWQYLNGTHTAPAAGLSDATLTFTLPLTSGSYELRLFHNNTYAVLATSVVIEVVAPRITPSATTVAPGATVTATIANGPSNASDWAGLYATGAPAANYGQWQYLNGTHTAPAAGLSGTALTFTMPLTPGTYELRFMRNNTYAVLATSAAITIQ